MGEVGIRELKTRLSSVLHRVDEGEQITVTRRGQPIADIVPPGGRRGGERMRKLVAEGRVTPAARSRPGHPPRPLDTGRSASAVVLSERDEER